MSHQDDRRDEEGVAGIAGSMRSEDVAHILAPEIIVTPAATHTAMCVLVGKLLISARENTVGRATMPSTVMRQSTKPAACRR